MLLVCGGAECAKSVRTAISGLSWDDPPVRATLRVFGRLISVATRILESVAIQNAEARTNRSYSSCFAQPVVDASAEVLRAIQTDRGDLVGATTRLVAKLEAFAASKHENIRRMERRRKKQRTEHGEEALKNFVLGSAAEQNLVVFANMDEEVGPGLLSNAAADAYAFFEAYGQTVESPITMLEVKEAFPSAFAAVSQSVFPFVKIPPCVATWPDGLQAANGILGDDALQSIVTFHRAMFGAALDTVDGTCDVEGEIASLAVDEQEPAGGSREAPTGGSSDVSTWMAGRTAGSRVWTAVQAISQMTTRVSKNTSPQHGCFTSAQIHREVERDGGGPISLRQVQRVLRALRRFKRVAPVSIHKIAPRDHPRSFWALYNVR